MLAFYRADPDNERRHPSSGSGQNGWWQRYEATLDEMLTALCLLAFQRQISPSLPPIAPVGDEERI